MFLSVMFIIPHLQAKKGWRLLDVFLLAGLEQRG